MMPKWPNVRPRTRSLRPILTELAPRFEGKTSHKLAIKYEAMGALKRQIEAGEPFDVVTMTLPAVIDELAKGGKVAAGTQVTIGRTGVGMIVRAGLAKPDISSTEAFKRALLNAKSITYTREGATGMYLSTLFERLGIADEVKPKIKTQALGGRTAHAVAAGEAEIGLASIGTFADLPQAGHHPPRQFGRALSHRPQGRWARLLFSPAAEAEGEGARWRDPHAPGDGGGLRALFPLGAPAPDPMGVFGDCPSVRPGLQVEARFASRAQRLALSGDPLQDWREICACSPSQSQAPPCSSSGPLFSFSSKQAGKSNAERYLPA